MESRRTTIMAFDAAETARLTGLSKWQLRHWLDIVHPFWPSGAYSFRDLVALRSLATLQAKHGISTQAFRRVAKYIRNNTEEHLSCVKIGIGPNDKLYVFRKSDSVWESVDGAGQIVAEIALDHVMDELRKSIISARERPRAQWGTTSRSPGICGNRETFAGTRVAVGLVVDRIKSGATIKSIREEFPTLQTPDITLARKLAAGGE
jgi:uncharacterized protein (DUF433 family)